MIALSCGLLCKGLQFFFCKGSQYASGGRFYMGGESHNVKYNFFQEIIDRKCKRIYNPDIVKNSIDSEA